MAGRTALREHRQTTTAPIAVCEVRTLRRQDQRARFEVAMRPDFRPRRPIPLDDGQVCARVSGHTAEDQLHRQAVRARRAEALAEWCVDVLPAHT